MASPSFSARAVNPDDLPAPTASEIARAARRHATLAALFGLTAVGGPATAQMGVHGMRGQQPESPRPDKDARDTHDANPPRDLVAAFARRLHDGVPDLALTPPQQAPWRDFVARLTEVGQHNERRLQRILARSAATVSAASPLRSYITAEVDEGEGRQEALAELKVASDKLDSLIDERQRDLVANLFVATRSELQASRDR